MTRRQLYSAIILIGFIPTITVFIWGVKQALKTQAEPIVPWFSQMQ